MFETVVSGQNKKWGKPAGKLLPVNTPMTMETDNAAQTVTRPDNRVFKLMTMTADVANTPLKRGERVWVVADGGNLEAVAAQTGAAPKFDEVITDQKIPVQAGASLGHLGFFQLPTETGFRSRYMVHIECLTSDSKVVSFLTNPEAAGHESPAFLKYPAGAKLFSKDAKGTMAENSRKTSSPSVLTLTDVTAEPADGTPTHYLLPAPENGYVAAASVEVLSQFDLGKLGFCIIKDDPDSFQLLDAENQPQNVVKGIFEKLKVAAEDDPAFSNALASHKYKQLLDVIDQNNDGYYSVDEYRNALHNPTYRDPLYQLIVQHPSEWYYEKTDAKWTKYLEKLEPDASKWKEYTEAFLDKMIWMKKVADMGPAPWHMHPVMFMGNLDRKPTNLVSCSFCQSGIEVNPELLIHCFGISKEKADLYAPLLTTGFIKYEINNCLRISHFLGQIGIETQRLTKLKESLYYTSGDRLWGIYYSLLNAGLKRRFPTYSEEQRKQYTKDHLVRNEDELAQTLSPSNYEGMDYRGRGLIHLTHEENYNKYKIFSENDVITNPKIIETNSALAVDSACWYWSKFANINPLADADNLSMVTYKINAARLEMAARGTIKDLAINYIKQNNIGCKK